MAQIVTAKGHEGKFHLVRKGDKNSRLRPVEGGPDLMIPTGDIELTDQKSPELPKQTEEGKPTPKVAKPKPPIQEEAIEPFVIPTSNSPFWARRYTRQEISILEFPDLSQAKIGLASLLEASEIKTFGNATFKVDADTLYELHNFTLQELRE